MHRVKCLKCNQYFDRDKEPFIKVGNRYAHKECPEDLECDTEAIQRKADEDFFFSHIKRIYGDNYNYVLIHGQAQNYIQQYGYTWGGMAWAIHWFYDLQNKSTEGSNDGIGIIPYIYNTAREARMKILDAEEKNREKKIVREPVYFNIQSPRAQVQPPHLLDMEENDNENIDT